MSDKLKILFIPADNIKANISRSYFFAKGLSKYTDLYFITWEDYRSKQWLGGKITKLNTLKCFLKSVLANQKIIQKNDENFKRIICSVFIDALVGRLIGKVKAKKIMRKHNLQTLKKIINTIKPDVVFYSDASYFFPTIDNENIIKVCDIQDDLDWNKLSIGVQNYEKSYRKLHYNNYDLQYIVSENAKKNVTKNFGNIPFKVVYNGAEFKELQQDYSIQINELKKKLKIEDKFIITHIGSATWVDPIFTKKLFQEIYEKDKSIVLVLVGSMDYIDLPNIINIGMVSSSESYIYYNLTDLALLLKDSKNSNFLYNSVPLKNIQYGAVKKPVISFPIEWLEQSNFKNTKIIDSEDTTKWIKEILSIRENFKWSDTDEKQWENYNWDYICSEMHSNIKSKVNSLNS